MENPKLSSEVIAVPVQKTEEEIQDLVKTQVLQLLGRPDTLQRVSVTKIKEACYRVNIWVREYITAFRMDTLIPKHSFFIKTDDLGQIRSSEPHINMVYCANAEKV